MSITFGHVKATRRMMNTVRAFLLKCEAFFYNLCPSHSLRGKRCENVKIVTVFGRKLGQQQRGQQKQMSQAIFGTEQCQGTSPLRNTASNSGIPPAQGREEKCGGQGSWEALFS